MSTLILFSGGIDSTALAAVVAKTPHALGVHPVGSLVLYSYASKGLAKVATRLRPLVNLLSDSSEGVWPEGIRLVVEGLGLEDSPQEDRPEGGHQTCYPLLSGYGPDRDSLPYTTGLHMALAARAVNLLAHEPLPPYGPRQALWGFQEDGPVWDAADKGTLPKYDASVGWVAALNALMAESPTRTRFRAPFLDQRMDRTQIVKLGMDLGVPWELTSSCVYGWDPKGCGGCWQCVRRARVFSTLGVKILCRRRSSPYQRAFALTLTTSWC